MGIHVYKSKDPYPHYVITGYGDSTKSWTIYEVGAAKNGCFYRMTVKMPTPQDTVEELQRNYITECLYRCCSFSGGAGACRTFEEFIGSSLYPIDYIGITVGSLAELWGADYQIGDYWYRGAAKPVFYTDNRVPLTFYYLDLELTGTIQGNEEIMLARADLSSAIDEIAPGIPAKATCLQLAELGYRGELCNWEETGGDPDSGATSTYQLYYSPEILLNFVWFNDQDPRITYPERAEIISIRNE